MYFYDPLYLLIMIVSVLLSFGAQAWVWAAVRSQANVPLRSGMTGAQVAELVLSRSGLSGLRIEETYGWLSDHYDPTTRTLRLSPDNYRGQSVAAAGIAAHEAGHAIQHAQGYWPMSVRQKMVPLANVGTQLGVLLVIIGMSIGFLGLAKIGVLVFAAFVLFTIVTLPVEFDASRRAMAQINDLGLVSAGESQGARKVLTAAAMTYVAGALAALSQLAYWLLVLRR